MKTKIQKAKNAEERKLQREKKIQVEKEEAEVIENINKKISREKRIKIIDDDMKPTRYEKNKVKGAICTACKVEKAKHSLLVTKYTKGITENVAPFRWKRCKVCQRQWCSNCKNSSRVKEHLLTCKL